jgi:hypothetical protein
VPPLAQIVTVTGFVSFVTFHTLSAHLGLCAGPTPRLKILAYVKHYTAYNVESSRFTFTANVSQFTMFDSYLPQYQMAFQEGQASGAMCSYFAPNGVSLCGNPWLLNGMLRGAAPGWNRPDAVVERYALSYCQFVCVYKLECLRTQLITAVCCRQ